MSDVCFENKSLCYIHVLITNAIHKDLMRVAPYQKSQTQGYAGLTFPHIMEYRHSSREGRHSTSNYEMSK